MGWISRPLCEKCGNYEDRADLCAKGLKLKKGVETVCGSFKKEEENGD